MTIDDAFARLPANCQAFVKMDIEGSEYRVLDDLLKHWGNIVGLAIEFHDVDILWQRCSILSSRRSSATSTSSIFTATTWEA